MNAIRVAALWTINLALFAALIDAAIETFAGGSSIRLAVAGGVLVYAVFLVLVWPRVSLTLKALLSFALLTAMIAYDNWSLGTLASAPGLKLGGLAADVIAVGNLALLDVATVVALLFARRVPVALRIIGAVVLAYPLVSIGYALAHGAGLTQALQTNAPLPPGPYWLRGAFVAAAVVLPAAAIVSLVAAIVLAVRKRPAGAARLAAAVLVFALAAQMSGLETRNAGLPAIALAAGSFVPSTIAANQEPTPQPQQTASSSSTASTQASPAALETAQTQQTGQTSGAASGDVIPAEFRIPDSGNAQDANVTLEAPPKSPPVQASDVATRLDAIAASLPKQDFDVDTAADQLAGGVAPAFAFVRDNIRFESYSGMLRGVHGTFDARAGNAMDRSVLLGHILDRKGIHVRLAVGHLTQPLADRLYDRMFVAPSGVLAKAASTLTLPDTGGLRNRVFARARRDYATITAALGHTTAAAGVPTRADVDTEIATHTWLQAQVNGQWIDLDTSFPDAVVGHAYTTADQTYTAIPDAREQHVTIRVIGETLQSGALIDNTSLEVTLPAWQLIDKQIVLGHSGTGLSGTLVGDKDSGTPVLWIAGDEHAGKPIHFAPAAANSGAIGGAVAALGGTSTTAPNAPAFVSESLEFEVDKPDGTKDVTRRTLVDRSDPAWRESTTHDASGLHDLPRNAAGGLVVLESLYDVWMTAGDHDLRGYADAAAALAHSISTPAPGASPPAMTFDEEIWPFALANFALPVMSDRVIVPSLDDSPQVHFYADSPRIFVFGMQPDANGKGATIDTDLRRDSIRGVSHDPSGASAVLAHKLWFGVLEGALEQEIGAQAAPASADPANASSTSSLLASSGVTVLRPGADAGASDKQTAAALRTALATGDTLVVPKSVLQGGPAGWWQIAHASGDTHAVLDTSINGFKVYDPIGSAGGETPVWGNVGGKTVRLNGPYGAGGGKTGGNGGGEIGEYNATNDLMAWTADDYKIMGGLVAGAVTIIAALFEACK